MEYNAQAVALTLVNRRTRNVMGNSYYGDSYRDIVLAKSQYEGLTGNDGVVYDRAAGSDLTAPLWAMAVDLAGSMLTAQVRANGNAEAERLFFLENLDIAKDDTYANILLCRQFKQYKGKVNAGMSEVTIIGDNMFYYFDVEGR